MPNLNSTSRVSLDSSKSSADHGHSASLTEIAEVISPLISDGGGDSGGLIVASLMISSAQILVCHDTPVTVIAAPGSGKFLRLIESTFERVGGTTGYQNLDGVPGLYYANDLTLNVEYLDVGGVLSGVNDVGRVQGAAASGGLAKPGTNVALIFTIQNTNPTAGDYNLAVYVSYLITTSLA